MQGTHLEAEATPALALDEWERGLYERVAAHFAAAHGRVDAVCRAHFLSPRRVLARHWQHRGDIPHDLANVPRVTWSLLRRLGGRAQAQPQRFSGKELALAQVIAEELLQLPELEQTLLDWLRRHPHWSEEKQDELTRLLAAHTPEQAAARVQRALTRLSVAQDGGRDVLLFLGLGLAGRALSDKVAFGSATLLGSMAATSVYVSQQGLLGALWVKWAGAPAWVGAAGAAGGFALLLLSAPVLAPAVELGINRLRAKRFLHRLIDNVERQVEGERHDAFSLAGYLGTYVQLLPDVVTVLRGFR